MTNNESSTERNVGAAVIWTAVALLGTAALTYVVARRIMRGQSPLDADALLEAADRAANNLDAILMSESQVAS